MKFALVWFGMAAACWAQTAPHVVKVVGERQKLVLRSDGSIVGWGGVGGGLLGPVAAIPAVSSWSTGLVNLSLPGEAIDVAAGENASFVLLENGSVWAWGRFVNAGKDTETPVRLPGFSNAVKIVAGGGNVLALLKDGTVSAWGPRGSGMIGDGVNPKTYGDTAPAAYTAVQVPGARGITQISASSNHVLALTGDGRVLAWGSNYYGALGRQPRQELAIDSAGEVPGLADVTMVAAGLGVSTVVKRNGTVWVWGSNWHAQFGNGDRDGGVGMNHGWYLTPAQVPGVTGITSISVGQMGRHTLALRNDGVIIGWGNTDWGQLGAGVSGTFQPKPTPVKLAGVKEVFAAGNNSFALLKDNSLWIWGIKSASGFPYAVNAKVPVRMELK